MDPKINLKDAQVKTVRLTCDHAVIDGLTLDLTMNNPENQEPAKGVAPASASMSSVPTPGKQSGTSATTPPTPPSTTPPQAKPVSSSASVPSSIQSHTTSEPNAPLVAADHAKDGKFHLLLAASGSVATIKIPNIIRSLSQHPNLSIRLILTESSAKFLAGQSAEQPDLATIAKYPNVDAIYRNEDEWEIPWTRGAPILHIELRRWADLMVIAPLSANTLAKISAGFCDNLLTSVVRAWQVEPGFSAAGGGGADTSLVNGQPDESKHAGQTDHSSRSNPRQKRIIVAPAMNTAMWRHPLTALHLRAPGEEQFYHWFDVLRPIEKTLVCGDSGNGAMCEWTKIVEVIKDTIAAHEKHRRESAT